MRIIAGAAKGRRLGAPRGKSTRPMTDRAKEAIFSSLGQAVSDAVVLDLYAGSGSLGLEALSRGARSALFVEWRREARRSIKQNIDAVGLGGEIVAERVETFLERPSGPYDLAFVDPPYEDSTESVEAVLTRLAPLLADSALVIVHRRSGSGEIGGPESLTLLDRRRYGDAEISRFSREVAA